MRTRWQCRKQAQVSQKLENVRAESARRHGGFLQRHQPEPGRRQPERPEPGPLRQRAERLDLRPGRLLQRHGFFQAVNRAEAAGTLTVPALGTSAKTNSPCLDTRSFEAMAAGRAAGHLARFRDGHQAA
jgi:hypothetical protein